MATISLCMIVKNEEKNLPRCLASVHDLVDEIIIVDTGSTDSTKEEAGKFTEKVYDFEWIDDFAAARNFSFSKAEKEFCLWLDADDVIEPPDREAFKTLKKSLNSAVDVVMLRYHTAFDEAGKPSFTYYRERLIRRNAGLMWQGAVHEAIAPVGNVIYSEAAITHRKASASDPDRNLRIFERLLKEGKALAPREKFYYARELSAHGRDEEAAELLQRFLDSGEGWVENNIEACRSLSLCLKHLGKNEESFLALVRSFRYGEPRAEICCDIGGFFFSKENFSTAAYWYRRALACKRQDSSGAFVVPDCYGYIPCLQLCVCMYKLGDTDAAEKYNSLAGSFKPWGEAYRWNKSFFDTLHDSRGST